MTEKEPKAVSCPFCGAPYKEFIPPNVMQLKCQYCTATFIVPPTIGRGIPQCPNHHNKMAIGICNDCRKSFCDECLHIYNLDTQKERVTLHLCPDCLRHRYAEKANKIVYGGILFMMYGTFVSLLLLPLGIFFALIGVVVIIYGISKRSEIPEKPTIAEIWTEERRRKAELASIGEVDIEELYNELLSRYISHWGVSTGAELLDGEIMAHIRHGTSFPEAVRKVYLRHQKKTSTKLQ